MFSYNDFSISSTGPNSFVFPTQDASSTETFQREYVMYIGGHYNASTLILPNNIFRITVSTDTATGELLNYNCPYTIHAGTGTPDHCTMGGYSSVEDGIPNDWVCVYIHFLIFANASPQTFTISFNNYDEVLSETYTSIVRIV